MKVKMKWFLPSFWLSLLMGKSTTQTEKSTGTVSLLVPSTPTGSKAPAKRGRPKGSKNKTKSKHTASRKLLTQKKSKSSSKKRTK
jgi:hypothetical protein